MRLIDGDHLEERVRKIIKDYSQATKDEGVMLGRVIFSSCGVVGLVKSESTVDAVPVRHGRWKCADDLYESAVCSVCGWETSDPWTLAKILYKFCPNCGADMRGEQDG